MDIDFEIKKLKNLDLKNKNPFFTMTHEQNNFIIEGKTLKEEELDNMILDLIKSIKGYYKLRFYEKLYYINSNLTKSKQPFIITKSTKPEKKKLNGKEAYVIEFN